MSSSANIPQIFDRRAVRMHRDRAATRIDAVEPFLRDAADRLLDRLDDTTLRFDCALDVGGRGVIAPLLLARGVAHVTACDLSPSMAAINTGAHRIAADEEALPFADASFDLIIASLSLHWVNDLLGALIQLRRALRPQGLLLASVPARGTLAELRAALAQAEETLAGGVSSRVSPYADLRDCAGLLQRAGFALPVADMEILTLEYRASIGILRDLRSAGEANATFARSRHPPPLNMFGMALAALPTRHGRTAHSFQMAVLTGWKS